LIAKTFIILPKRLFRIKHLLSGAYCTGESSFEVKIEADGNDITEHPHDDKPVIGMFGFPDTLFTAIIFTRDSRNCYSAS